VVSHDENVAFVRPDSKLVVDDEVLGNPENGARIINDLPEEPFIEGKESDEYIFTSMETGAEDETRIALDTNVTSTREAGMLTLSDKGEVGEFTGTTTEKHDTERPVHAPVE
jgi:hypothetical protein